MGKLKSTANVVSIHFCRVLSADGKHGSDTGKTFHRK